MGSLTDEELMLLPPAEAQARGLWDRWLALDAKIREGHRARRAARKAAKPADFGWQHVHLGKPPRST